LCHYNRVTYKIWEGCSNDISSPEFTVCLSNQSAHPFGILKGGTYGGKEKSQEESQKEKVSFDM